jgi:hypothetical protein
METSYDPDDYYYRESTMMESHYEGGYADCWPENPDIREPENPGSRILIIII